MADLPVRVFPPRNVITPWHRESIGTVIGGLAIAGLRQCTSATFVANRVYYFPFVLYEPATAYTMSYIVGATANGNVDLGIYDHEKNRLVNSGSVAQGTINTLQEIAITDTPLVPGRYFMAITCSSSTGTRFGVTGSDEVLLSQCPLYAATPGSFGLPDPAVLTMQTDGTPPIIAMGVHFSSLV